MTPRERFFRTMRHERTDRAPYDLCGTPMTLLFAPALEAQIRDALGITGEYTGRYKACDERVLRALGIDFRRMGAMLRPVTGLEKQFSPTHRRDGWGIERVLSGNDWQICSSPLRDATIEDIRDYPFPDPGTIDEAYFDAMRDEAKYLYEETDAVVVAEHPIYGVLELGCWLMGFDEFLYRMAAEPEFVQALFDRLYEYQRVAIERYYGKVGQYIHVTTSGDDFGTQNGPFVSPAMFDELVAPYYDKRIALTAQTTNAVFFHHSCGGIFPLIPRLIKSGVKILNPIQPGAKDMEPERLRDAYGDKLVFWGGIDTQHVLPEGTPEDVEKHVRNVLRAFDEKGGYVLAPAHCLQSDVPAENVVAMYRAADAYFSEK